MAYIGNKRITLPLQLVASGEEYNIFWDSFQENGNRTQYPYAFYYPCWNDITYNPKYPIVIDANGNTISTFAYSTITDTKVNITIKSQAQQTFYKCSNLVTIRSLTITESATIARNLFADCPALENLTITEGSVISTDPNLSLCPKLTHDSLISVITALKDYSGSGESYTLTIGATNLEKITEDEMYIAEQKGWSIV